MRIGLIGAGRIGRFHARTLGSLGEVDTLVIADVDRSAAAEVATEVGAVVAGSVEDLFDAVDAVVIAAPTSAHAELVGCAAARGVAAFCEKPLAADVATARSLADAVAAAGIPLQVGFQRRFDPGIRAVRAAALEGRLGWLHTVRSYTCDPVPPSASYLAGSGGIFRDCVLHDFDIIRWVTGAEVVSVCAVGANRGADMFAAADDVDTAAAVLTLSDGTLAICSATRYNGAGYDVRLEACGSAATLVAGLDEQAPLRTADGPVPGAGRPYRNFVERFHAAYTAELEAFVEVVAGRRASPCSGGEAVAAMLVAEAADLSRRAGRPVAVAEARV